MVRQHPTCDTVLLPMSNPKLVIAVRTDLKMRRGKESAQIGHASMAWVFRHSQVTPHIDEWIDPKKGDQTKIVVAVDSEQELLALLEQAFMAGVETYPIRDAGHTEVAPNTLTCASFGPALPETLDPILGHLRLR